MTDAIFGPLLGLPDIEKAALNQLEAWLPEMLSVVERVKGMPVGTLHRPPSPDSYYGGLDFLSIQKDRLPAVIVGVQPTGSTERTAGLYGSWFEIQVGVAIMTEDEHESRMMAGYYGIAVSAAVVQHGSLGGISSRTEMVGAPAVEFIEDDKRRLVLSRTTFHAYVDGLVDESAGTNTPTPQQAPEYSGSPDQPYGNRPVVTSTPVTLVAEPVE